MAWCNDIHSAGAGRQTVNEPVAICFPSSVPAAALDARQAMNKQYACNDQTVELIS